MDGTTEPTILHELANLVGKSAPLLGSILGSPLAGIGIGLLSSVFNINSDQKMELLKAIQNDPEAEIKIRQLENQHKESLLQIKAQIYSTEVDDRKNARTREIAINDHVPAILAFVFLAIYSAVQLYAITHDDPAIDLISARVQDVLIMIVSYYFGGVHKKNNAPNEKGA